MIGPPPRPSRTAGAGRATLLWTLGAGIVFNGAVSEHEFQLGQFRMPAHDCQFGHIHRPSVCTALADGSFQHINADNMLILSVLIRTPP